MVVLIANNRVLLFEPIPSALAIMSPYMIESNRLASLLEIGMFTLMT